MDRNLCHQTMPDHGTPPKLLAHVDSAQCVAHPDGRWSIRVEGWLIYDDTEFVVVQAGIPDEPIVMLSTVPRADLCKTFSSLRPDSKPGFTGNIPCSTPRTGPLPITFLCLLPNGATTAFTIQTIVRLERQQKGETPATERRAHAEPTRILFMTDSLEPPLNRAEQHLGTLRELVREGFAVTVLETERIGSLVRAEPLPSTIPCIPTNPSDELDQLLLRHLPSYDVIWVTQPGGLRLLNATSPGVHEKIIFEPSITFMDDVLASTSEVRVEHHTFSARSLPEHDRSETERPRLVSCPDQVGAIYPLQWFVALANTATLVIAPDSESASQLNAVGVTRVLPKSMTTSSLVDVALASTRPRRHAIPAAIRYPAAHTPAPLPPIKSRVPDILVDIIVPIHNAAYELSGCLDALSRNTDLPSHLILVDDHSNDPQIQEILSSIPSKLQGTSIQHLTIIRLSRNAGFAGAVNIGLVAGTSPYVVLLNSDTVPPPHWLSRLIAPLKTDSSIGSVTPLSNSATICSFRPLYEPEQFFDANVLLRTDSLFAQHGGSEPITIPTGVGFCLASRRSTYDQIGFLDADLFRRMYGEENDWCMRIISAGLRNVLVTNLFVPHVDGASAADSNVNRRDLLDKNLAKLRALYPDYDAFIEEFVRRDPLRPLRNLMHLVLLKDKGRPVTTLYVHNPELVGGSSRYLDQLIAQQNRARGSLILAATSDEISLQRTQHESRERLPIRDYMDDDARFRELLSAFNIQEIVVNQMVGSAYDILTERIRNCGVPYTVHLHDFFYACPTITLIGQSGRYCGGETRVSQCSACLRACFGNGSNTNALSITAWREHSHEFLKGASAVVTVSKQTRDLYRRYFPDLVIRVEEPVVKLPSPTRTLHDSSTSLPILNVAVIGAIGKHKGSDLIYEIVESLRTRALPIKLVVCGYTDRHSEPYIDRHGFFEVTGGYEPSELPKLLARHRIAFTLLPSIWPETFLYTASESIAYGYPVMVSGLTAAASRIAERDAGWVLKDLTAPGIIRDLERLFYNRQEIVEKTKNILSTGSASADPNAPVVVASQHPFKEFLVEL